MKKIIGLVLCGLAGLVMAAGAEAAIRTSTPAGGDWAATTTWVGGVVPLATDSVVIATTGAGAVTTSGSTITCAGLTINSGSVLTMWRPFIVNGTTSITGTINFGSTAGSRIMTFNGAVTLNGGAVWNETTTGAAATFTFTNNFTNNATTFTAQNTAHGFSGTGMTLSGATVTAFPTVTFTGNYTNSGTLSASTLLTVTGAAIRLTNNGTIIATASLAGTGGVTQGASATLNLGGTTTITTLIANAVGNTVNYNGAAQTVDTPAPATYYNLTLSGSGIKTMPATALTVTSNFTMSGAAGTNATAKQTLTVGNLSIGANNTFANSTFALNVAGDFAQNGTFTSGTGVVTLNGGAAVQTISGTGPLVFANLTDSNTGGITLARNVTVTSAIIGTVTLTSTCPTDYLLTSNGGATVQHSCDTPPAPFAVYSMDEPSWNGTTGEVADSAGSNPGTAATLTTPLPTTANTSGAIAGDPGTCRYGVFDRTKKNYVALPASFPNLGASTGTNTSFAITAWIRTTDATLGAQRVFIDDEQGTQGYGLSLGEGGTGVLRFYTRGTPSVLILDTPNVIASNVWYFVAAVADLPNKLKSVYVYNQAGTLLANVSATWTEANFGTGDAGVASIGGETNIAVSENTNAFGFAGNIDEVRVYQSALSASQVNLVRQITHGCAPAGPDHIVITHAGNALTCSPQTVTITACANLLCTTPHYSGGVNVTLTPGGQTFAIDATGINSVATVQQSTSGSATLAATSVPAATYACWNTVTSTTSCAMTFSDSGFVVTVPNHTSCSNVSATIEAVQTAPGTGRCVPAYQSVTRAVNLYSSYVSPATGTQVVTASTGAVSTAALGTAHSLAFDATGKATITLSYPDAGQLTLTATDTAPTGAAMTNLTGSGSFVVAPASFAFSGIPVAPLTAGSAFNATVKAMNACATPAMTANFAGTAAITSSNPLPGIGNATAINTPLTVTAGTGSANLTWNEVGTITLNANLANYLGSGLSVAGIQTGVGRFQPAYFDTVVTPGCSTFTYAGSITPLKAGQSFKVEVTANKAGGGTTKNYAGSFAYDTTLSNAGVTAGFASNTIAAASFTNGVGSANVTYAVSTPQTAPLTLAMRAMDADPTPVSSSGHAEGAAAIRSGRAKLLNAYGSELLNMAVPFTAEYYASGQGWTTNQADSCTVATLPALTLQPGGTVVSKSLNSPFVNGNGGLTLVSPGVSGYVDMTATVDAWLQYSWGGAGASNPSARATFGVYARNSLYGGSTLFVYRGRHGR